MPVIRRTGDRPYTVAYGLVDVADVANKERHIPLAWITPDGLDVTSEFVEYVRPLVAGEVAPYCVDGLPHHIPAL